jgi:hypothetical protein
LLADVLEHITKPEKESLSLISLQLNCSTFIISIPNIANMWMRLSSLFGKFDYISRGILERTHVRFFTRATFLAFVEQNGLRINEFHATPIPLSLVNPFFVNT